MSHTAGGRTAPIALERRRRGRRGLESSDEIESFFWLVSYSRRLDLGESTGLIESQGLSGSQAGMIVGGENLFLIRSRFQRSPVYP